MSRNGCNPMRWNCDKQGCFNKKRRPKTEIFHDLFPGMVSFGDVDGIVEVNGFALVLEWKGVGVPLSTGQKMMWERLTKVGKGESSNVPLLTFSVLVVEGCAETMTVKSVSTIYSGILSEPVATSLDGLRELIAEWVKKATQQFNPRIG